MKGACDIPDATDWLETPLKDFATLENLLHCQICKEFYDTPMITSCCHTFCSKCIRTSLSADGKCPACRTADQASKLRNNWVLQELVTAFNDARPAALEVARKEQEAAVETRRPGKRKRVVLSSEDEVRTTRSKSRRIAASQESQPDILEVEDSDEDETFEPEEHAAEDGLVECPLGCGKRMKIESVEPHLDKCEDEKKSYRAQSRTPVNGFGSSTPFASSEQNTASERLPELSYSLFNDSKLSKKLKELGIPNGGSKQLMVKRHKEWVNIWNANCDSNRPRNKRELLQELDGWERTQGGRAPNPNGLSSTIMKKDFDAVGWASTNKSDFSRLIADAKRKKSNPAIEPEKAKDATFDGANDALDGVDDRRADGNAFEIEGHGTKPDFEPGPTLLHKSLEPHASNRALRYPSDLPRGNTHPLIPALEHTDLEANGDSGQTAHLPLLQPLVNNTPSQPDDRHSVPIASTGVEYYDADGSLTTNGLS